MKNKISPRPDVEDARNEKKRIASGRGRDSPEVGFIFADELHRELSLRIVVKEAGHPVLS